MGDAYLVPDLAPLNRHRLGALTSLGRHPENSVEIPDRSVSKFHAQIQRQPDGTHLVIDLGSRNGTYVGGQRVQRHLLDEGNELVLGTVRFRFHAEQMTSSVTSAFRVADVLKAAGGGGGLTILGPSGGSATRVELHAGESSIQHSNTVDVGQARFLPVKEVADEETLRRDYERLRIAHEMSAALRLDAPEEELLRDIANRLFELIKADRCAILMMAEDGASLEPRVVMERGGGEPKEAMPLSQTLLSEVITHKKAVLATDAITDGRFQAAASIVALSMRSAMCVPLLYEDELFGAIHVDSLHHAHAFAPTDLQIFSSIANQASVALKNRTLVAQVEREAETRARLGRLLSPNLVDEVVAGHLDLAQGGAQREAVVMFTDIRGFTRMSESMAAKDVMAMLNEYFDTMVDVVFEMGGTLDKYMGDAIMALFGVPKASERASQDAVLCGLKMQAALRSLNRVRGARGEQPIEMGVGINVGQVIWGPLGSRKTMDYTVVGDVVNLASRLCSAAKSDEIIISGDVAARVRDDVVLLELEPATLKGKSEPVAVWKVLAEKT